MTTATLLQIETQETSSEMVRLDAIDVTEIAEADVRWMADEIERSGLQQPPVLVRYQAKNHEVRYAVAAGKRRIAALRLLGRTEVKAEVRERATTTHEEQSLITLVENSRRRDNPYVEYEAIEALLKGGAMDEKGVAKRIGKPVSWVAGRRSIGRLIPVLADALRRGRMTFTTSQQAVKLTTSEQRAVVRRAEARHADLNIPASSPLTITGDDVASVLNKGAIDPASLFETDVHAAVAPGVQADESLAGLSGGVERLIARYKHQPEVVERLQLASNWLQEALAVAKDEGEVAND